MAVTGWRVSPWGGLERLPDLCTGGLLSWIEPFKILISHFRKLSNAHRQDYIRQEYTRIFNGKERMTIIAINVLHAYG